MTRRCGVLALLLALVGLVACDEAALPAIDALPDRPEPPDPFVMLDGRRVAPADFERERRPELLRLFAHYVYGLQPAAEAVRAQSLVTIEDFEGGSYEEVELRYGPEGAPPIDLAIFRPAGPGPFPVFLVMNKCGNQGLSTDPRLRMTRSAINAYCVGDPRGIQASAFPIATILARGYALATFQSSDVEEDASTATARANGIRAFLHPSASTETEWGVLAAWSYGMSRAVDYLVAAPRLDGARIAVAGHSRWGKTALLTGALDPRVKLVIPHQSGTAGVKLSRSLAGEPIASLTTAYPHWTNGVFPGFANREARLPIDQHLLVALVAPRALLATDGDADDWADPAGARRSIEAADAVWKALGSDGATVEPDGSLRFDAPLTWRTRPGGHTLEAQDWAVFLDYADLRL